MNHYSEHVAAVRAHHEAALTAAHFDHAMIFAGGLRYRFQDDMPHPFVANPNFLWYLPLTRHPYSWVQATPGQRPTLFYYQPRDYWHLPPADPDGFWVDHFDIRILRSPSDVLDHWPSGRVAVIGETDTLGFGVEGDVNPALVIDLLHWARAAKTDYELAALAEASRLGAMAHTAAANAFRQGLSEFEINQAYLDALQAGDHDMPYGNIVALNEHGAVLHYDQPQRERPASSRSFLIDAGARARGYASDITRTHSAADDEFNQLILAMDEHQLKLCDMVTTGRDYADIHLAAHRAVADLLARFEIIKCSADAAFESGLTSTFFPHGVGHLLGLQVHDVGGHQATPTGGSKPPPTQHPFLRLTRELPDQAVVTVEPGLYFIDMLLDELHASPAGAEVNWSRIDDLKPFGGVRIEDNVVAGEHAHNLTRAAFADL